MPRLHSAPDPARRLAALAGLLRPGVSLIVIENDFAHHPISWPVDFEQRVFNAHHRYLQSRCSEDASLERYHSARHLPAWLRQAGLKPAFVHTYVSEDMAPLPPDVEAIGACSWRGCGAGCSRTWPRKTGALHDLSDPPSPDYLPVQSDAYCVELTTVACGIAPGSETACQVDYRFAISGSARVHDPAPSYSRRVA